MTAHTKHLTGKRHRRASGGLAMISAALCLIAMLMPSAGWAQPGQAERGKPLYARYCERCHGPDGRRGPMAGMLPVTPRNLADDAYMQTRTAQQLFDVIKHGGKALGLSPVMEGFGNRLSDEQIWDTAAYVRTLSESAAASPAPVAEAEPGDVRLQQLSVSIWPEYDDPRVLVILRGELALQSPTPTRIRLPLPKGAELLGAGMISPQNELLNHPHERVAGEDSDTLLLTLPTRRFFAEWYYDPFGEREPARQFTYDLAFAYAIAQLDVDILQPDAATEFRIDPEPMRQDVDPRGGKHHRFTYQNLEPEAARAFQIAYVKTTEEPSVAKAGANSQAGNAQASGLSRNAKTWAAFIMLAGFAVIFAGAVFIFRNKQPAPGAQPKAAPPAPAAVPAAGANYCSNCGRQLQAAYAFCPGCGRSLQTP